MGRGTSRVAPLVLRTPDPVFFEGAALSGTLLAERYDRKLRGAYSPSRRLL